MKRAILTVLFVLVTVLAFSETETLTVEVRGFAKYDDSGEILAIISSVNSQQYGFLVPKKYLTTVQLYTLNTTFNQIGGISLVIEVNKPIPIDNVIDGTMPIYVVSNYRIVDVLSGYGASVGRSHYSFLLRSYP